MDETPAKTKGLMWTIFALTATFSAVVLPAHILLVTQNWPQDYSAWYIVPYFIILIFSCLYHSLYRFTVFIKDIGYNHLAGLIGKLSFIIILLATISSIFLFY
jgi:hypothetical protein